MTTREHSRDNSCEIRRVFLEGEDLEAGRTWEVHGGESEERKVFGRGFRKETMHGEG